MTMYVVPIAEHDLKLNAELEMLGIYGIDRHLIVWHVVDSLVNGYDAKDNLASEIFEMIEENQTATGKPTLQTAMEIDMEMSYAGIQIENAMNKLVPYIEHFLLTITDLETRKHSQPIQYTAERRHGLDIIIETTPVEDSNGNSDT